MKTIYDLSPEDISKIADDAIKISKKDSKEIYKVIGNGLYDQGLQPTSSGNTKLLASIHGNNNVLQPLKAFLFASDTKALTATDSETNGKKFFKRLKERVGKVLCSDINIKNFISGEGNFSVKDALKYAIPIILGAIGITVINPAILAVIVGALALLIKEGFDTYCEVYVNV